MSEPTTNVQVKRETWKRLNALKDPGDDFDTVIQDLLDAYEAADRDTAESAESAPSDDPITDALDGWRPGRSADERNERRPVGRTALSWLREHGPATRQEVIDALYADHNPMEISADAWWRTVVLSALQHARDRGYVEFRDGVKEWQWTSE